jgi:hypothetical protein
MPAGGAVVKARERETTRRKSAARPVRPVRQADVPLGDDNARRFAQCRSLGHEWRHRGREAAIDGIPVFVSVCADCGTQRRVYIPLTGANVYRRYIYPDGYQRRGEDRLSSVQWRRVFIVSLG